MQIVLLKKNENGEFQKLTEVLPNGMIPNNCILHKPTGARATYSEIKADRPSIIIEPNVPPIITKMNDPKHKNDNIIPVYEGVTVEHIIAKFTRHNPKIITTPESFPKVKEAFEQMDIYMHGYAFMLVDECHQNVTEAGYRPSINQIMDDFLLFRQKALVSATPLAFSDPRLDDFEVLKVEPVEDILINIDLYPTNNVLKTLETIIKKESDKPFFFYINSVDLTFSIMQKLEITGESALFCSQEAVEKAKREYKFKTAYSIWKPEYMRNYNFTTKRFQSAVDIIIPQHPLVFLVTDVFFAEHSMLDPETDVIQFIGRFRNGITSVAHVANTNNRLPSLSPTFLKGYIRECEAVYDALGGFYKNATSKESKEAFHDAQKSVPFNQWLDKEGRKDYFAIDNFYHGEIVKSYYHDIEEFKLAYAKCPIFKQKVHNGYIFPVGDRERLKRENKSLSQKEIAKEIIEQLELIGECETKSGQDFKKELQEIDPFIVEAYETIGKPMIEALNYSRPRIKEAMIMKRYEEKTTGTEFQQLLKNSFQVNKKYTRKFVKAELKRIYDLLGIIPPDTITAQTINEYFVTTETTIKNSKAILVIASKV